MKKITFLLFACVAFCWQANAQLTEDFENTPLAGWTLLQTEADDPGFVQTTARANSGAASFYHNDDNITVESTSWMISPAYTVLAGEQLSYFYNQTYPTYAVESGVWISTTSGDPIANPGDFTEIYDLDANFSNEAWTLNTHDLTTYVGETVYVAFKYVGDWADELYIDDFAIAPPSAAPECATTPFPGDVTTDVATGDVTFTWVAPTSGPTPTSYNLFAGTMADYSDQALVGNFTTESALITITGYDTTFYWQIVPVNGTAVATGCPYWSFTTESAPPPPANDTCATAEVITVGEGMCGPTVTGSNVNATDSGEAAPSYGYYSGGDIWYQFVVPAGSTQVNVEIESSAFSTTILAVYNTTMACGSLVEEYSVNAYAGSNIAVTGLTAGDTYLLRMYDWTNDDFGDVVFCLSTPPSCLVPTGLNVSNITETSADLGWTEAGTATTWNVEWGAATFTQGTGTMITGTTNNPESLNPLTPSTAYEFYVQADCGGGDLSAWAGPFAFTTNGPPPANDDCAGAENIVPSPTSAIVWSTGTTANNTASGEVSDADISCISSYSFGNGRDIWYTVEVPAAGDITIETRSVSGSPMLDTEVVVFSGTCGAFVGTEVGCDTDGSPDGYFSIVTLTGQTPGAILYVRVNEYATSATSGAQDGIFEIAAHATDPTLLSIQDFNIDSAFTYYPNPVNNSLTLNAQKDIQNVAIYNMLGQEVLRTAPNTVNSEVDMSNLQPGAYFVNVTVENATKTIKVIKK
ncbi:choice-of-anchor J domain-containing protein [Xanthomarina sp. GH4-25]|uniref:choice-of-anchor J domain-containing protein n=1 Tax=Xanthomarina sp. GH4-25 TaxID=3349335 RepID=UPI0038781784